MLSWRHMLTLLWGSSSIKITAHLYLCALFLCILHFENERLSFSIKYPLYQDISVKFQVCHTWYLLVRRLNLKFSYFDVWMEMQKDMVSLKSCLSIYILVLCPRFILSLFLNTSVFCSQMQLKEMSLVWYTSKIDLLEEWRKFRVIVPAMEWKDSNHPAFS